MTIMNELNIELDQEHLTLWLTTYMSSRAQQTGNSDSDPWPLFVKALEQFCHMMKWELDRGDDPSLRSLAIFADSVNYPDRWERTEGESDEIPF